METNDTTTPVAADNTASTVDEPVLTPGSADAEGAAATATTGEGTKGKDAEAPVLNPDALEKGNAEANELTGVPENYEDFTLPEGFSISDEDKGVLHGMCKELNLSQKGAQKLVDAYTKQVAAQKAAEIEALAQRRKEWRSEIRQRPTYAAEHALAVKGMKAVLETPEEKELFTNSWMSDHPTIFNIFTRVGRLLGEDSPLPAGSGGSGSENINSKRFPNA